jgi:YggT family protein
MGPYAANAAVFLIEILFGFYILAVMLRFLLQWVRADFRNPVSHFLIKITNPTLVPLRRFIPGWAGVDLAAIVLMFALKCVELVLVYLIKAGAIPKISGLLVLAAGQLLWTLTMVYLVSLLIQFVLSWLAPQGYNPVVALVHQLNEPLLRPARRLIPPLGGLDFSLMVVGIGLILVQMLVVHPILDLGAALAF